MTENFNHSSSSTEKNLFNAENQTSINETTKSSESNISHSSFSKELLCNIKDKVLNKSDSTLELSPVDYKQEYEVLIKAKDVANQISRNSRANEIMNKVQIGKNGDRAAFDLGLEAYIKIDIDLEQILKRLDAEPDKDKNKPLFLKFIDLRKLIFSNIARVYEGYEMYRDAIKYDEFIVRYIDPKFDKSYARLINCFRKLKEFNNADLIRKLMEKVFTPDVLSKYKDIFNYLDEDLKDYNRNFNKLGKKIMKKSLTTVKEDKNENTSVDSKSKENSIPTNEDKHSETSIKHFKQRNNYWFKWVFGGLFLFGTSTGLYYLFKNKNRFLIK